MWKRAREMEPTPNAQNKQRTKRLNKSIVTFFFPFLSVKFRFRCAHNERYCYANVLWAHRIKLSFSLFLSLESVDKNVEFIVISFVCAFEFLNRKTAFNGLNLEMTTDECDDDYHGVVEDDDDEEDGSSWRSPVTMWKCWKCFWINKKKSHFLEQRFAHLFEFWLKFSGN